MSNNYASSSDSGASQNSSTFTSRREAYNKDITGALPPLELASTERGYAGPFDIEVFIASLHEVFERDRQVASQTDATRCGVCYLHYPLSELHYREEGLYMCQRCEQAIGNHRMPVIHKQQKM